MNTCPVFVTELTMEGLLLRPKKGTKAKTESKQATIDLQSQLPSPFSARWVSKCGVLLAAYYGARVILDNYAPTVRPSTYVGTDTIERADFRLAADQYKGRLQVDMDRADARIVRDGLPVSL